MSITHTSLLPKAYIPAVPFPSASALSPPVFCTTTPCSYLPCVCLFYPLSDFIYCVMTCLQCHAQPASTSPILERAGSTGRAGSKAGQRSAHSSTGVDTILGEDTWLWQRRLASQAAFRQYLEQLLAAGAKGRTASDKTQLQQQLMYQVGAPKLTRCASGGTGKRKYGPVSFLPEADCQVCDVAMGVGFFKSGTACAPDLLLFSPV